jgi:putative hydrolase of the HAD superfamily
MSDRWSACNVRAIFFDAVGTLIHPDPPASVVYAAVGRRHGSRLGPEAIDLRFRAAFRRQESADFADSFRTSEAREHDRWRQIVAEVLDDVTHPDACFQELFAHFARPDAWRLDPDAGDTIAALEKQGCILGLASNYDHRLRSVVAGLPELAPLRHLAISSEIGWRKPAREFFAAVCRMANLPPEQVFHVGDDPVNDYDGARAAGLPAALIDPRGRCDRPGSLRSLKDLTDWRLPCGS